LFRYRCRTCARTVTRTTGCAFVIGIRSGGDISANAIRPAAFFRRGTRLARAHADIAATRSIDAIIGQTLRGGRATKSIVVLAHVFPVARAVRAIVVRVGIISNRSTDPVNTAAFFGYATSHAFVVAFAVATKSVDAIARRALRSQRARHGIRRRCNHLFDSIWRIPTRVANRIRFIDDDASATTAT
jgi:hypothetical protein